MRKNGRKKKEVKDMSVKAEIKLRDQYKGYEYIPQDSKREHVTVEYKGNTYKLLHSKIGAIIGMAVAPYISKDEKTGIFKIWVIGVKTLSKKRDKDGSLYLEGYAYCVAICDTEHEAKEEQLPIVCSAINAARNGKKAVKFTALERKKIKVEPRKNTKRIHRESDMRDARAEVIGLDS